MKTVPSTLLVLASLPPLALAPATSLAAPPPRAINIVALPSSYLPPPVVTRSSDANAAGGGAALNSTTTGRAPATRFEAAPVPNRDVDAPLARAGTDPSLSAGLFTRRDQYRGEGITPNSSAQIDQERHVLPGAGFKLRMPLQQ